MSNRLKKNLAVDLRESILNQTHASLSLAKHVISKDTANFVFSPVSIHVVLSMIAAGAKGSTKDQLLSFLKSKSTKQLDSIFSEIVNHVLAKRTSVEDGPYGGPCLSSAKSIWIDRRFPFKSSFQEVVQNSYTTVVKNVDFQNKCEEARKKVNMWAKKETKGLIKEILPSGSVNELTRLILANALYFKAFWVDRFTAYFTKDYKFFLSDGSSVKAPFMTHPRPCSFRAFDGFKVLKLPYKQGGDAREFSMYIYLPDANDGLPSLMEKFTSESGFIEHHLPYQSLYLNVLRIPKFKIEYGFEASKVLKGLGLELPFSPGGLTKMVDDEEEGRLLFVTDIFHKSIIDVNEEGIEAAASTTSVFYCGSARCDPVKYEDEFVADHPFLFVIREDTSGVLLFFGQVVNPLAC